VPTAPVPFQLLSIGPRRLIRELKRRLAASRWVYVRNFFTLPWHPGTTVTAKRVLNLYRARYEAVRGRTTLRSYPTKLTVEASNVCNLACTACFTGLGETNGRKSMMSLDAYRRLLDELGDYLFEMEFYSWGEPLLSKFVYEMIEMAHERGIMTSISTNFSIPFDEARAERLVRSGLTQLGVSLDGARQESYERYRVNGKIDTVLRNCRLIAEAKKRLGSTSPRFVWEFHVMDIELATQMAADLDMEICISKGWVTGEEWNRGGQFQFFSEGVAFPCIFLWQYAVVNTDGGVAPCCGSYYPEDDMGRLAISPDEIGPQTFHEIWNGPRFQTARGLFHNRNGSAEVQRSICFDCPQTVAWERWRNHRLVGRSPLEFSAGYTENDTWNFFWGRRHRRSRTALPDAR
jgi:organic radical activating enzyme